MYQSKSKNGSAKTATAHRCWVALVAEVALLALIIAPSIPAVAADRGTTTEYPLPSPASNPRVTIAWPDGNIWLADTAGRKIGQLLLQPTPRAVAINSSQRTVTNGRVYLAWSTITPTNPEQLSVIYWPLPHSATNLTNAAPEQAPGQGPEFFGDSTGFVPGTYPGPTGPAVALVVFNTGTWSQSSDHRVEIRSTSSPTSPPIITTYSFPNWSDVFFIQRTFEFGGTAFPYDFRPYVPRLYPETTYNEVLYPTTSNTLATAYATDCEFGCLPPDWASSRGWYAINDATTAAGLLVMAQPSLYTVKLAIDEDALSFTNSTAFYLVAPAGGFRGYVTEKLALCFYDSTTWPATMRIQLRLPSSCHKEHSERG